MRHFSFFIILCFFVVALSGCKKAQMRSQLKAIIGSSIVLPEHISCVYGGEVFPMSDSLRNKDKLIVFVDSISCTKCRITHFIRYEELFSMARETGSFDVIILLSTGKRDYEEIKRHLCDIELYCPVYLDDEHEFARLNTLFVESRLPKSAFVDYAGVIKLIGDPTEDSKILSLYKDYITNFPKNFKTNKQ